MTEVLTYEALKAERDALADRVDALAANRDAQPVIVVGDDGGDALAYRRLIQSFAPGTKLYTAPPAPAYPERLPCPVHLLPGLKFGKGVPTRSMLDALVRRAEYEAELDAMTPEQKAENDERLEKLKALIPLPAPSAAGELLEAMEEVIRISDRDHEAWDKAKAAISACRAAMLAQPVSSGYKLQDGWRLVPVEPTTEMINAALAAGAISIRTAYSAMLAAAPEGGNG